jgi:ABC-type branched-subunit amino acid transport system substrate-binding protein
VSTRTINIGFEVSDADEAFKALGFGNLTTGNTKNQVNALVSYINSQGGLAGRKINPVLYQVPTANSGNNAQTECAHFTQDHKVFAVIGAGAGSSLDLIRCLAKANTVYVDGYGSLNQSAASSVRGYWYDPADFLLDRFARFYVDQLVALGYFTPNAKIGLLSYDDPRFRDVVTKVLKPALARHGLRVADEALYSTSAYASQSSGFVLKFQTEGITHVLNLVAGVVVFFQLAAENQRYRPRYALSSRDGPGSFIQVLSPPAQLTGSLGIGWQPFADVDLAHSPGDVSPNQALCRNIMKRAGEDTSNGGVLVTTGRYCETTFFLRAALERATALTPGGLLSAVGRLGAAYPPVTTFKTYFDDNRQDGPAQIRPFSFVSGCSCFQYTGPKRDLPTQ